MAGTNRLLAAGLKSLSQDGMSAVRVNCGAFYPRTGRQP